MFFMVLKGCASSNHEIIAFVDLFEKILAYSFKYRKPRRVRLKPKNS
jgi:hypothetical protein